MQPMLHNQADLEPEIQAFYCEAMEILADAGIPFLIGGAYALARYTGITRHTKDFDVFLKPADCERALAAFQAKGYRAELTFPHWLAKVFGEDYFIDLIFSSGNGIVSVDDDWFTYAVEGKVLGRPVLLCPAEEIIWSKSFIMERERFDGADIAHLLRASASALDWPRLLRRFGPHWRVLLAHLILFGYIYPTERVQLPAAVLENLLDRLRREQSHPAAGEPVCQGTLLSRSQYLLDIEDWGYKDARLTPRGPMSEEHIAQWTAAIGNDTPPVNQPD